jgi:flagellar motor protein MotB
LPLVTRIPACFTIALLLLTACGVPRAQYDELHVYAVRLKNDSTILDKRIRQLNDEREYLRTRSATMEQQLTSRLQEKEDSITHKEQLLAEKEHSIRDMRARKEQEREAFETLARSVFGLFGEYPASEVNRHSNCTQIIIETADRMLFQAHSARIDAARAQPFLSKVQMAFEKNPDLSLMIVSHTDSLTASRQEDGWSIGSQKAAALVRALLKEGGFAPQRISAGTRAETTGLSKANVSLGRNRIEFVFYSTLLPCIHSKD